MKKLEKKTLIIDLWKISQLSRKLREKNQKIKKKLLVKNFLKLLLENKKEKL